MSRELLCFALSMGCGFWVGLTGLCFRVDVAEIDEPCAHEVQFGGMCANCGKDMTQYVI